MTVIPLVLTQHAEEAAFLWQLRDGAIHGPHYQLWNLARHDERLDAHLDGLVVAGDDGWAFALEQLDAHPEPGETFACAFIGFHRGNQARIAKVLEAAADPAKRRAVVSAIGWLPDAQQAADYALQFGLSGSPLERQIGVAVAGIRRLPYGPVVQRGLTDKDPGVTARAARAAGELGAVNAAGALRGLLGSKDYDTRFWSAWSLALLANDSAGIAELKTVALTEKRFRRRAVDMIARRGEPRTTAKWVSALEATPGGTRLVIQGLGALGDPEAVPRLLQWMKDPPLARVAAEAFAHITGVHISYDKLEADPPEGFEAGPTEDPADENVAMDIDLNLYWPDVAKCTAWWEKNRSKFAAGTRHLCGRPMTPESLREVLKTGYQRQRAAAALELALRVPGKPLFEVRTPGFRQRVPEK